MNLITVVTLFFVHLLTAQSFEIKGHFSKIQNQEIALIGFEGFKEKVIHNTMIDDSGSFLLSYPADYQGAAKVQITGGESIIVLLNKEHFQIEWEDVKDYSTLKINGSKENENFEKAIILNQQAEQKLAGLNYLLKHYEKDTKQLKWLKSEISLQEKQLPDFTAQLPPKAVVYHYVLLRRFIALLSAENTDQTQIAKCENDFKLIDFNNEYLWHSGLVEELFTKFYQMMLKDKNSNQNQRINSTIDTWLQKLSGSIHKQQEIGEFCFRFFEKNIIPSASEHISLSLLNASNCTLDEKRIDLFEQYRKLGIGATAPDIDLGTNLKLSTLQKSYKLVVFGASWCPSCQTDYPSLLGKYKRLKEKYDFEVVYISLDKDKEAFESYYSEAPFITFCDFKVWETQAVQDYHVFATPTYMLLDANLQILAKPKSPEDLEHWFTK